MLKQGDKIGEYILINKVGSGGFGDVWKAEKRTALDANYFALKFFRPKDDRLDLDKIGREIKVWKQLKGLPHIISVTELDQFEDYVYVVSDFAEGGSLENWLQANGGKASSQEEAVKITLQLLTGLENLHEKGFVHRDLKPDNILIMNGKYCLADFGISREIKTHSKATGTAGTMEYMPPEAFTKTPSVTPQTDIWAVGVILQKLLTGELPYPQEDYPSLVSAILMYEPEPMPASVPEGLREIVKKALKKDRENRFQTAWEMREALKNPLMFLAERTEKRKNSETIIDKDFDKAEFLKPEPIQDLREIEAEKSKKLAEEQRQREEAERKRQADLEQKQREAEIERQKELEHQRRQAEEANRQEEIKRRNQEEAKSQEAKRVRTKRYEENNQQRHPRLGLIIGGGICIAIIIFGGVIWIISLNSPSNVATNKAMNTSLTSSNDTNTFKNSIGMEFVKIPAGSFMMGPLTSETVSYKDERPQHQVTISKDFYLGKYEVTQGQWKAVMGDNPSDFPSCGDNCPVQNVSWEDVQEFIKKLNAKGEGTYRLPTEAEWEYACRAGTTGAYSGSNLDEIAWYDKNSGGKTHPVGQKKANAFGLYDMHGNVWEWTADWHGEYSSGDVTDPRGASSGSNRVIRGGGWGNPAVSLRSALRNNYSPSFRYVLVGFRLLRD